jgi:hypothetical protein
MVVAEYPLQETSVRTGLHSSIATKGFRLETIALRWKILSARLILPEKMGESFKEMREKMSQSAIFSQHPVQRT